jgi:hypothetical protein
MAFGVCDGIAASLGIHSDYHLPEPVTIVVYFVGAFLLGRAARSRSVLLYALPVLLSVDNLLGGAPTTLAPALGIGSALMALFGLSVSLLIRPALVASHAEV